MEFTYKEQKVTICKLSDLPIGIWYEIAPLQLFENSIITKYVCRRTSRECTFAGTKIGFSTPYFYGTDQPEECLSGYTRYIESLKNDGVITATLVRKIE